MEQLEAAHRAQQALSERCAKAEGALEAARSEASAATAALQTERSQSSTRMTTLVVEHDELKSEHELLRIECDDLRTERDGLRVERDGLRSERDDLQARLDAAPAAEPAAAAPAAESSFVVTTTADGVWDLLLAELTRRWPAPVMALAAAARGEGAEAAEGEGEPAVEGDAVAAQMAEAFVRELERLREEVGVDAEISVTGSISPSDPVVFLLASLEVLGAVTSTCQRVVVNVDDQLNLVGEDFEGRRDELDVARNRALAAGATVTPIEIVDDQVRVSVIPAVG
jgi:FtsZ-binding cell division protein ZapB